MRASAIRRVVIGSALFAAATACGREPKGATVRVVIPPGATFAATTDSLSRARVIDFPRFFSVYASMTGRDRLVKPGTYRFHRHTGWVEVLDALIEGRAAARTVTIPEGFAIREIVPLLAGALDVPRAMVQAALADSSLRRRLDLPTKTVEGYLFPSTYTFPEGTGPPAAIAAMVRQFELRWRPEWDERLRELSMSRHDIVTLASIVEEEAIKPEERAVIAAVYHNRLKRRMPLQADPTVQYALGRHVGRVLYRDLRVDSPYNTYRYRGLPPGPISSPGSASIEAALYPAQVPYLYFVAHPDGHHEFRTTFAEHTEAVRRVRGAAAAESAARGGR